MQKISPSQQGTTGEIAFAELWQELRSRRISKARKNEIKRQLLLHYLWIVRYTLYNMNIPSNALLNEEDFLHVGILGLHDAIERFEPERGIKFETFAVPRVRGIILDEMRKLDWLSRSARQKVHELTEISDRLRSELGREASPEEIQARLGISPEEYQSYLSAMAAANATFSMMNSEVTYDDEGNEHDTIEELPDFDAETPFSRLVREERVNFVREYLQQLPERKRLVMTLYYYEELTFKEIGEILGLTESRICQIHTQICNDLRKKLQQYEAEQASPQRKG
ncbi:MAG: FliA/WhiG family RNA polymerase sigma factor [Candidatus Kapabacteria bacterium]|nr:FliA/WhiG family RNA polymerase sigma factor [Candidatus Kapabacteria bacterium]